MDWSLAIHRNRVALLAVVASIAAFIGGAEGGLIARRLRNAALALLRPAEAAVRRLIVIAARGLIETVLVASRPAPSFAAAPAAGGGSARSPAFRLFDPRQRFVLRFKAPPPRGVPRIRSFWAAPSAPPPAPVKLRAAAPAFVASAPLTRRLAALRRALANLPQRGPPPRPLAAPLQGATCAAAGSSAGVAGGFGPGGR